ncbi:Fibrinogen-like protein A,Ryncolin-4,Angiopoietin-related protein 1,Ficolin-3,Ficolin-1-B,Techylectin-5A,Ficolin-2,Ryncolin-1,Tenascin-R,Fibrinogen-like protein 1,Angiopoietin-related protein 4,Angiopoietin-1,Tenascin-X,Fibrinogen C domain-containing protein 1-A,Tenascin-N,Ryncolin-3,Tenascin,Fibroleukin,Fibrinogen C domain-containing protein 1,Ryncolin-2,Techylectin-5B,Angiopoietin-related protein 2,Microfibril-associated glycoprotein 4,Fibrinogen alpha chain,Ficolin-1-A,Ficolin-1,Fibrinogen C domain-cont|uniref:Fibrinogen C-terminal domain-containing protein n=1 Tax=Mytilus coruscus TaxID=42192 RepID=A0A6J8ESJ5_MYTCO|nr:Fibrinogen-like protein A,Ryncolin-4,Angiopoietin-related protein 1,Ficolin-3,Ficolin-1-B,Techylectin-5A,Ficolin-2,Ryncolin-1,Tenascin-R,Fibrinogen-like protein 1,Angiopoietin-related protein 4,Angiopoietin-1,Tenascin-X,Fibrinogen C domain-containing protein 1-A,Tenascin-N,Ryncolin-3,Tenascin,Fibroleukin,Fibrinogen C domain-containing protein 1,Ryncolin-2,Techylectin-5B,Angiopoietin-related protein 2,Microfibril-associated glycoprotein 4,Fibrinogen alpha chain,Ficolin-1-A,Ficolin-1,Fibrinogen C 
MVIEKQKDVIYTGHVAFEIFTIPMWSLCAQLCTRLSICKSVNFITLTKSCQINIAEPNCPTSCLSSSFGDSFVAASALPKELAGICKGHACNITEICVPKSKSEGYLCHPIIGYRIVPPKVHIPQSSYDGIFGQSVTLVCIVTSQLQLTDVTWKKHEGGSVSTIDPDDSGSFYRDGDVELPSLIILNVTLNDTGTYVCSASNKVDTRSSDTITLIVHSVPIVFVHQLSYNATFGSTVTFDCTVSTTTSSTITDVYWQKTNECQTKNISSTTTSSSAKYSGGTVNTPSLTIMNADGLDVSSYTCFASNIAGTGRSSASFLNVSAAVFPRDCSALHPLSESGLYRIYPSASVNFNVNCDMDTKCGGWTVFQQRFDGAYDFFRGWNDYKTGFGDLHKEFWLGNDYIHYITSSGQYRLRVELEAYDGSTAYAEYSTFSIGDSLSGYILNVSGYSGTAEDSFGYQNWMKFSTLDRDNDIASWDCAAASGGAWWYSDCYSSNLNGRHGIGDDRTGIVWRGFKGFSSLKASKMMIKRYY